MVGVSLLTEATGEPRGFVGQFVDITAAKDAEAKRGEFLSHVSHELRSPLAVVHQFASLLIDEVGGPLSADQRDFLTVLMRNAGQLKVMIDDLLHVTRSDTGQVTVTCRAMSLDVVLTEASDAYLWDAKRRRITLTLEHGELPIVVADGDRVREVLANLLDNALKFTPDGGHVTLGATPQGESVCVSVRDTGRGLAPGDHDRIFERFFQAENNGEESRNGLGLGVSICRDLVERQGGTIWASDNPGPGTAVSFTLPILGSHHGAR